MRGVALGNVQKNCCSIVAKYRTEFYFSQWVGAVKKLQDPSIAGYFTLGNSLFNLCHDKIARQVARKIA